MPWSDSSAFYRVRITFFLKKRKEPKVNVVCFAFLKKLEKVLLASFYVAIFWSK